MYVGINIGMKSLGLGLRLYVKGCSQKGGPGASVLPND